MFNPIKLLSCCAIALQFTSQAQPNKAPAVSLDPAPNTWPYWPAYHKTPVNQVTQQVWQAADHSIDGWDWSLPPEVKPAPNGLLAVYRISSIDLPLSKEIVALNLPVNLTLEIWVKWRDLEPAEGQYRFDLLKDRIAEAAQLNCKVVVRMLCSATSFAPEWLEVYKIPQRAESSKKKSKVTNYDISQPDFHTRYLKLVRALGESGIPQIDAVKGAYVGYASPSYGDEGIGPDEKNPDAHPHVIERLDAWAQAFRGFENKVFMGGISHHGFKLGFGTRRGFVEMYLYNLPNPEIGQTVDKDGYVFVDDTVDLLRKGGFHGEENEEYEESWATAQRQFRFGKNTDSFTYRYFISNLRTIQMHCNHVLMNPFSIYPEQMVWVGQSLGRTVKDTPDIWCALRESYLRTAPVAKNIEHWLYQRDTPTFETQPVVKIQHPIAMWMVNPKKRYDCIARSGKQIGFAVDDRWTDEKPLPVAIKTTYFDHGSGAIEVKINSASGPVSKSIPLTNTGKLITNTIFVIDALFTAKKFDYDLTYTTTGDPAVLSFVRIVRIP